MLRGNELITERFVNPLISCGWRVNSNGNNEYSLISPDSSIRKNVRVYMRNVTEQGRDQPDKRRFQMMDIGATPDIENLLIGWSDEFGVYVAWDANLHSDHAAQAMLSCYTTILENAQDEGYAAGTRNNNMHGVIEKYIAFNSDFLETYITNIDVIFDMQDDFTIPEPGVDSSSPTSSNPPETYTEDEFQRRERTRTATEKVRDHRFKKRILEAYNGECAICRTSISSILQGAHIKPVADNGSDDITNGILLCANHHAMFDRNLLKINPDYSVTVTDPNALNEDWYQSLQNLYAGRIQLPMNPIHYPSLDNINQRYDINN